MKNTSSLDRQLSFDDLFGDDLLFFNKDVDTRGKYNKRKKSLIHDDECECFTCFKESLMR